MPSAEEHLEVVRAAREELARAARGVAAAHANACVKCGLCGESCHIYRTEPTPENLPAAKAGEVLRFYRRHHTLVGRLAPGLVGAREITPESLGRLVEAVYGRCTGCGRCGLHCSIGLDVAAVIRAGRQMLAVAERTRERLAAEGAAGTGVAGAGGDGPASLDGRLVPEGLQRTVANQLETGNQMAISREELISTAQWLSDDLKLETGREDAVIPIDQPGRRILYLVNPREVKFFPLSLSAAAGVFAAAGESWTLSSKFYDVTNYGLFSGDDAAAGELTRRVIEEAQTLGVQEIILGECGHGFRAFRWEGPNWMGRAYPLPMRSVLELLDEYLGTAPVSGAGAPAARRARIRVDLAKNAARVTLHDPCNLVRWGGVSEPQRRVLRACCADFVEMTPNRLDNFCCGGGGGMLSMSEFGGRRVASGQLKADQIRATGAKIVASPCHNCADQLLELNKRYKLGVEIQAVVELVYSALVWE